MLVITYLQQEFVLLPQLQNWDLVGEEYRARILERYQRIRWLSFVIVPFLLLLRLSLVTICLFIGSFFFSEMGGKKFKEWWTIAIVAQSVMLLYSVLLVLVNLCFGETTESAFSSYTSLLFLSEEHTENWILIPLSAINIFEILYWVIMSYLVGRLCNTKFRKSFHFVISSYGVGYFFYIALLMFLILYLS